MNALPRHCVDSYAVEVVSDHDNPDQAIAWMLTHGALDAISDDDHTVRSAWIVEGCADRAQAGPQAAATVRQHAPGCTYADWWEQQKVQVVP